MQPSSYQQKIFDTVETGTGNIIVNAVAGSGKTTTIVGAARRLPDSASALFVAFNKHIAEHLATKLPKNVKSATLHSVGFSALRQNRVMRIDERKYWSISATLLDKRIANSPRSDVALLTKIANLARLSLVTPTDIAALDALARMHALPVKNENYAEILELVAPVLRESITQARAGRIDFTDQLWMPVIERHIQPAQFSHIFVDESQDLSACAIALLKKCGLPTTRYVFVGDRNQAIYGFAGAMPTSINTIQSKFNCTELPLSICYRCPESHIKLAQKIVPQIEAAPGADVGEIYELDTNQVANWLDDGDLVLSRKTAPLVKFAIKLITSYRIECSVVGKDIFENVQTVTEQITRQFGYRYSSFDYYADVWRDNQLSKYSDLDPASEDARTNINDIADAVIAIWQAFPASDAVTLIEIFKNVFTGSANSVKLSTVHRAKGLEAERVFIINPDDLPLIWANQQDWQLQQELNLQYVAYTRAKRFIAFVSDTPSTGKQMELIENENRVPN